MDLDTLLNEVENDCKRFRAFVLANDIRLSEPAFDYRAVRFAMTYFMSVDAPDAAVMRRLVAVAPRCTTVERCEEELTRIIGRELYQSVFA